MRPAFYALGRGGWRDYVTLLHAPYTLWHLSYVAIGAALAPELHPQRLAATAAAFFLALGVSAHALDELRGRPLRTEIPTGALVLLGAVSLAGAVAIGVGYAVLVDAWILPFVAAGAFLVCAYNLELAGGRFHTDAWFALAWGSFPLLTGYFASANTIAPEAVLAAGFAGALSHAQRRLSAPVRRVRRRAVAVEGALELDDGTVEPVDRAFLLGPPEAALRALTLAVVLLAGALLVLRLA